MVQTLPAEDFSRTYSPNVVETFVQRIPGVTTNNNDQPPLSGPGGMLV
jgi:hypothetical protein